MSKMSQHFMDLPYQNESGLNDDPEYLIWAEQQDKKDTESQDKEPLPDPPF